MMSYLYPEDEVTFDKSGFGPLPDMLGSYAEEEGNSYFELYFEYPLFSSHERGDYNQIYVNMSDYLIEGNQVTYKPSHSREPHAFRIYKTEKQVERGIILVWARTRTADLRGNPVRRVVSNGAPVSSALSALKMASEETHPFSFTTNIQSNISFEKYQTNVLDALAGEEDSILAITGGQMIRTNNNIYVGINESSDDIVEFRLGKNIEGISYEVDYSNVVTAVIPFYTQTYKLVDDVRDEIVRDNAGGIVKNPDGSTKYVRTVGKKRESLDDEVIVYGDTVFSQYANDYSTPFYIFYEIRDDREDPGVDKDPLPPFTKADINNRAVDWFEWEENLGIDEPEVYVTVDIHDISQSSEYSHNVNLSKLETLNVFDKALVYVPEVGIDMDMEINYIRYDGVAEKNLEVRLGNAITSLRETMISPQQRDFNQKVQKLDHEIAKTSLSSDGKARIYWMATKPVGEFEIGDLWFDVSLDGGIYVWDGYDWVAKISSDFGKLVEDSVNAAIDTAEQAMADAKSAADQALIDAKAHAEAEVQASKEHFDGLMADMETDVSNAQATADSAVERIDTAVANAGFTSLDDTLKNMNNIANGVKSELDTAIENAGFTSLDDTIQSMNNVAIGAEQNAQQAIADASNAYGLAQTSIGEAKTAQEKSLAALGKADNALDGVSNLHVRVDDVKDELELKANNTYMTEDGELVTLSNAITFNANRFSSDMSRIESRVESLAGEINLVILRGSFENAILYGTEEFPNPTYSSGYNSNVMSDLIDVVGGESFALSKELTGTDDRWRIVFYDENHNYISRFHPPVNTRDIMVAPSNARYMWVAYPKDSKPQIIRGTDFMPYRPNMADQLTTDEMVIFRNEYDEFADRTERRLTSIDSSDGRLATAELLITKTANGLALKADQTTVDDLTGTVSDLGTDFKAVAGQVSSKVWKTDIDNIEFGGRNYFPVSKLEPKPAIGVDYPNNRVYHFNLEPETDYIISTVTTLTAFRLRNGGEFYKVNFSETNEKGHKLTTDTTGIISIGFWGGEVDRFIKGESLFQIEKGTKATDWIPALEDNDAKFNHIETEWTQTFNTFSQNVSDIDGRVTSQKQSIDTISSTVSGHDGRLTTVEQTASGLQSTVADKASQTQVTQLANGYDILVAESLKSLVAKNLFDDGSEWELGNNVEYIDQHVTKLSTIYVTGSNPDTLYGGNRVQVESVFTPGRRYKITLDVWTLPNRHISIGQAASSKNVRIAVGDTTKTYEVIYEASNANGFSIYFHDEGTYRIGNITVMESTAISQSQISVLQDSITSSVRSLDGRVTTQKQSLDTISGTVSGHDGRLSTVEQTARGLQSTVADKASQSQVTQLANGYDILVSEKLKSLVSKNLFDDASEWELHSDVEYRGEHTDNLSTIYVTGSNPDTLYGGNRVQVESVFTPGRRYKITLDVWTLPNRHISIGQAASSKNVRIAVGDTTKTYEVIYEASNANGFSIYFHDEGTYRIGNITVMESTAISQSQISVLQNNINLRVAKGDLISQFNIEAERTLIQSNKFVLDADSVVFTGSAFIPSAQIKSINADKIKSGSIDTGLIDAGAVVTGGLSANVIKSEHINATVALINKLFSEEAYIKALTSKTIFANQIKAIEINASKITSGELDGSKASITNIDAANIVANKTSFVESNFNAINSNLTVSGAELKYTHADGSYTRLNASGIQTVVGGSAYQHNYLTHVKNVTINSGSDGNVQWVDLPSVFKGKDFTYFMGATDIYGAVTETDYFNNKMVLKRFVLIKHPDYNIDYVNARIPILGYAHYVNIDSRKAYYRALQGIVFAQY